MRKMTMVAAMLLLAAGSAKAQSRLPFQDFSLGPHYQTVKSDFAGASSVGTMYGLQMAFSGSYLDALLRGANNRLRIGDYVGAHTTVSAADYESTGSQYFLGLGLSIGAQAGLNVTDYLDVGARYFVDFRDNKFGSLEDSQSLRLNTAVFMVRLAGLYIDAGAGSGKKARGDEAFRSSAMHVRYLFPDGGYAGVRLESVKIEYGLTDREDEIRSVVVQFGIMH
jgi:hypothetical protein